MTTLRSTKAVPPTLIYSKPRENKHAAHRQLQDQLEAFERAGGIIEKLGNTPLRKSA